jgi:hypothetical protein
MERYEDDFCMFAQDCLTFTDNREDQLNMVALRSRYNKWRSLNESRPSIHEIMLRHLMTWFHQEPVFTKHRTSRWEFVKLKPMD